MIRKQTTHSFLATLMLVGTAGADTVEIARPQLLLRKAIEGMPSSKIQELRVLTAAIKPGSMTPFHTHRYRVTIYILDGAFTPKMGGQPAEKLLRVDIGSRTTRRQQWNL